MTVDQLNACMETVLATNVWLGVRKLRKDRKVLGFFWPTNLFWSLFGCWGVAFYWMEGYVWSLGPASAVVFGNLAWLLHALCYARGRGTRVEVRVRNLSDV